jgi:hypothetical protein
LTPPDHHPVVIDTDAPMRSTRSFSTESLSRTRARLASAFEQHVAIALIACLLGLLLG